MGDKNRYYPLTEAEALRKKLEGMTVNERLYEMGKVEAFEMAAKAKNKDTIREILRSVFVDEKSIEKIIRVKPGFRS